MNIVMFAYTVVLMLVCATAAVMAAATYAVTKRRALLPQVWFFVCYILDIVNIFGYEWGQQNLPFDSSSYYEVENPVIHTLLSAAILLCLWLMLLNLLDVHGRAVKLVPPIVFVCLSGLILVALPYGALRQWLYYTMRQVFTAFALGFGLWRYLTSADELYKRRLERYKGRLIVLCVLLVAILIEDAYVILFAPIPTAESKWLLLYLSSRNFSENLMMLFVAYLCCRTNLETLALRSEVPPSGTVAPTAAATGEQADEDARKDERRHKDLRRHIDEQLPAYAAAHGLSPREREVLGLVLEGKDNRSIASELVLAEGTIKTHVHNIMKKTETSSRDALKKDFWSR